MLFTRGITIVEQGNRCPAVPLVLLCSIRLDGGIFWDFFGCFGQKNRIPVRKSNLAIWFWDINAPTVRKLR